MINHNKYIVEAKRQKSSKQVQVGSYMYLSMYVSIFFFFKIKECNLFSYIEILQLCKAGVKYLANKADFDSHSENASSLVPQVRSL